ncbi:MAG: heme ABC transporter ATP-binding protein [Corynebacterium glucuronolyticum]|nr:heme ABC transporter ATP-binding protein [Corynebacterium glucuronolyticum]
MTSLVATDLTVMIGTRALLSGVNCTAEAGTVTGIIGPNGAGKSTLLHALSGDITCTSGQIRLGTVNPFTASPRELARLRAVMLQDVRVAFSFLVRDIVGMGRNPWRGTAAAEKDEEIISSALAATGTTRLAGRDILTLSGGERARVALARVLAQQAPIMLFDEPTAAMDIRYQEQCLGLIREQARRGATVVVVLHDLNAAAAYCDRFICLRTGDVVAAGTASDVFHSEVLSAVYDWPIAVTRGADGLQITPKRARHPVSPGAQHVE